VDARLKTLHHRDALADLRGAYKAGELSAKEYEDGLRSLGIQEDRMTKLYKEIKEPARNFALDMQALNALMATGRITVDEYTAAANKLKDAFAGKEMRELLESVGAPRQKARVSVGGGAVAGGAFDDAINIDSSMSREQFDALRKYEQEVAEAQARAREVYDNPDNADQSQYLEKDLEQAASINSELQRRIDLTRRWHATLAAIRANDGDAQSIAGLKSGLNEIRTQMDVAAQAQRVVVQGFNDISTAITDLVTKGTADWRGMVRNMLAEMTKLLLFRILMKATGGPSPGALPGFATGGYIGPGGSGGTDSQVIAFRKSPDEDVLIRTPRQQDAGVGGKRSAAGRTVVVNKIVNVTDPNQAVNAMDSRKGTNLVRNVIGTNRKTVRGLVTRR
jgi:hypothetical protein